MLRLDWTDRGGAAARSPCYWWRVGGREVAATCSPRSLRCGGGTVTPKIARFTSALISKRTRRRRDGDRGGAGARSPCFWRRGGDGEVAATRSPRSLRCGGRSVTYEIARFTSPLISERTCRRRGSDRGGAAARSPCSWWRVGGREVAATRSPRSLRCGAATRSPPRSLGSPPR